RIVDARFFRNIFKGPIAAVTKQKVRLSRQSPRPALHRDSPEPAGFLITAELRKLIRIYKHVAGNKQVNISVAIEISPCSACAKPSGTESGFFVDIFELAVAQIAVQHVATVAGNVHILPAIIIEIRNCNPHSPPFSCESRLSRHLAELQNSFLMV